MAKPGPDQIRALRTENPKARARDFAAQHGITEADLVAAFVGHTVTAIVADPDRLMPWAVRLGEVMALTRTMLPVEVPILEPMTRPRVSYSVSLIVPAGLTRLIRRPMTSYSNVLSS